MDKEQLLAMFPFEKMEIKLQVTKGDNGLEITGSVTPQDSGEDKSENPEPETPDACDQNQTPAPEEPEYQYKVRSVKQSGKNSQLLEIEDKDGNVTAAYMRIGGQPIAVGSYLTDVDLQQKIGEYGAYNMISACQVAA